MSDNDEEQSTASGDNHASLPLPVFAESGSTKSESTKSDAAKNGCASSFLSWARKKYVNSNLTRILHPPENAEEFEITEEEVNSPVQTLAVMNALFLTVPYGIMTTLGPSFWTEFNTNLSLCENPNFTFSASYDHVMTAICGVLYSSIICESLIVVFYLCKPPFGTSGTSKSERDDVYERERARFHEWWKSARFIFVLLLVGTLSSIVSLISLNSWLISYHMVSAQDMCDYNAYRYNHPGIVLTVVCFVLGWCLLL